MTQRDFLENVAPNLPLAPGCYMFLDSAGTVLYVGKSKCLKKRVASYFSSNKFEKFNVMLRFAKSIGIEQTKTDIEALLLEHKLIKKHRPQYNAKMRKDYQNWYIKFNDGVLITLDAEPPGFLVGPFSHKETAVEAIEILGKCFKLPTCNKSTHQVTRMCLRGHMKNCFAPCENKELGTGIYQQAIKFFQGNHNAALEGIRKKMQLAVSKLEYEKAAEYKALYEQLKSLSGYTANRVPILAKKQFVVYLKSRHEDCFMLVYLNDGECFARVLIDGLLDTAKMHDFASSIISLKSAISNEESKAFVRALTEISAIRRFYEMETEFTCVSAFLNSLSEIFVNEKPPQAVSASIFAVH